LKFQVDPAILARVRQRQAPRESLFGQVIEEPEEQ